MEKPGSLVTRISDHSEGAEDDDLWAEDSDYGISDRQLQEITLGWRKHSRDKSEFDAGGSEGAGTWRTLLARLVQIPMCSSMCSALPCTGNEGRKEERRKEGGKEGTKERRKERRKEGRQQQRKHLDNIPAGYW
ncbi:hypothetical protein AK812_SmicGene27590 [Symbiodinium microadriaticum]|uniref:Uncharacterized protein n=1 Tax=Symbiodinium microadriaticum TaxID=2951 RepID=A0A1Q9D6G3_SYMMI|nr:hypothetical protein AK812_SmicGene27590 [Symbiodinium microadriaticum]